MKGTEIVAWLVFMLFALVAVKMWAPTELAATLPWWIVLSPLWIPAAVAVFALGFMAMMSYKIDNPR